MNQLRKMLVPCACIAIFTGPCHAADSCQWIRGRAHLYGGDGQLRIWHIGTHHEFTPDEASGRDVLRWLDEGVSPADRHYASPASTVYLFGDFLICPTEPFKKGAVQRALVKDVKHRHYMRAE